VDDIEQLRRDLADARASEANLRDLVRQRQTQVESLGAERDAAIAERAQLTAERDAVRADAESTRGVAQAAVAKYREAVLGDPALVGVADLITGDSIEALDAAVERAKGIATKVREEIEKANASRGVPAGGNTRQPADTADMSAAEKIRAGVEAARAQ